MRNTAVRTLAQLATEGVDLHFITADLGFRVLEPFRDAHPARFTNAGVSEANMVSIAGGMAMTGIRPVCYSMVPFVFFRAFEQVRVDVVAPRLNVVLIGVGGGLSYGHEGVTHHAIEDLAMARSLPGLRVIAPADPRELTAALRWALTASGPTYIRVGQNNDPNVHENDVASVASPIRVRNGDDRFVVFSTGHITATAATAVDRLKQANGIGASLFSVPTLKPFDAERIREIVRTSRAVVTVEEHSVIGGLGTAIAELLFETRFVGRFAKIALPDEYCDTHGTLPWLRRRYELDDESIARRLAKVFDG